MDTIQKVAWSAKVYSKHIKENTTRWKPKILTATPAAIKSLHERA